MHVKLHVKIKDFQKIPGSSKSDETRVTKNQVFFSDFGFSITFEQTELETSNLDENVRLN